MTLDDLGDQFKDLSAQFKDFSVQFNTLSAQFNTLAAQFNALSGRFTGLENRMDGFETRMDGLDKKMDEGFNASKIRDEELLRLGRFSLEANEILREEMGRSFDQTDKKHDEQIDLLKTVVSAGPRR